MSSFVFATTPAVGHTVPALPIARALIERGHFVRWYAGAAFADKIRAIGATHLPMSANDYSQVGLDGFYPERKSHRGLGKIRFDIVSVFGGSVPGHLRDLRSVLAAEPADALVGDVALAAGPILHDLGGPPFAAFGISVVAFPGPDLPPFGLGLQPGGGRLRRRRNQLLGRLVASLISDPLAVAINETRATYGLSPRDDISLAAPGPAQLFLQLSTPGSDYPRTDLPSTVRYVGPPRPLSDPTWQMPTWWADLATDRPVILVNQGTVATDVDQLLRPALAGLADENALVVAVTGGTDPTLLADQPSNARIERYIPFEAILPYVDVFVTNGGFGGVQLALAHGVPILTAGRSEDKAEVSARVAYAGVGIDLRTQRPSAGKLRAGVRQLLDDVRYRNAAARVRAEIETAGRTDKAADLLERLALDGTDAPTAARVEH